MNEIYCGKLSCVDCRKTSTQNWTCNCLSPRLSQHLPMVPSVPQNKEWLSASSAGTWLGLPPAAGPWRPQGTSRAAGADPAGETPHCHGDWVGSAALQQPTSCLILPAHPPRVGLGTHHLFETNLLAVVPGFLCTKTN